MKTRQIIMTLLIAISVALTMNAVVADEITRTTEEAPIQDEAKNGERELEEPLIAPDPNEKSSEGSEEYDNVVGEDLPDDVPHILDVSNGDYDPEEAFGSDEKSENDDQVISSSLHLPIIIAIGFIGLLVVGLLVVKRR